jgi:hypothetical protein
MQRHSALSVGKSRNARQRKDMLVDRQEPAILFLRLLVSGHAAKDSKGLRRLERLTSQGHVYFGAFFRLEDHLRRFRASMGKLRKSRESDREIAGILADLVRRAGLREAYVAMDSAALMSQFCVRWRQPCWRHGRLARGGSGRRSQRPRLRYATRSTRYRPAAGRSTRPSSSRSSRQSCESFVREGSLDTREVERMSVRGATDAFSRSPLQPSSPPQFRASPRTFSVHRPTNQPTIRVSV